MQWGERLGVRKAFQHLGPEGAKFRLASTFEKADTSNGYLCFIYVLGFIYGSLHMEFKHELMVDNAVYCLCLKAGLGSRRIPFQCIT